ncbi:CLUMA_CG013914, isoform A [Clunio marinus]|uniref:CLUMA_CG013914, isoform A n=1 Tax=Clunio marinus TaxID=568069 RepID=A0A1J1INI9_9DIPT|nr:CLUMA_CG013914, isoform A [Clunio marinus]
MTTSKVLNRIDEMALQLHLVSFFSFNEDKAFERKYKQTSKQKSNQSFSICPTSYEWLQAVEASNRVFIYA